MARSPLYDKAIWRRRSALQLKQFPLCAMCERQGIVMAADVADHIEPIYNDINKLIMGELQSLCRTHHAGAKRRQELHGYSDEIGADGWPIDPAHPVYKATRGGGT